MKEKRASLFNFPELDETKKTTQNIFLTNTQLSLERENLEVYTVHGSYFRITDVLRLNLTSFCTVVHNEQQIYKILFSFRKYRI